MPRQSLQTPNTLGKRSSSTEGVSACSMADERLRSEAICMGSSKGKCLKERGLFNTIDNGSQPPPQSETPTNACLPRPDPAAKLVSLTSQFRRPVSEKPNLRSSWRGPKLHVWS